MIPVVVFYEDQAAGGINQFGPHLLLCACVADRLGTKSIWDVRKLVDGEPKKGADNLLAACKRHAKRNRNELVFAMFDADKVHVCLKAPKAPLEALRTALEEEIRSPKVRPFLLADSIETLVEASARCLEPPVEGPIRKRHNERDNLLARAATASRSVRDCISHAVPSFALLADAVASALS